MDCFDCVSLWVAAPFAFFVGPLRGWASILPTAVCWLALAGASALLQRLTQGRGAEPIIIERLAAPPEEEADDGLLQSTASRDLRIAS